MTILLVRHGHAGNRRDWDGPDRDRPLSDKGCRQADALARALADYAPARVLTSEWRRCVQTVEPLAAKVGIEIEERRELGEASGSAEPLRLLRENAAAGSTVVACSHGDVIPDILNALQWEDGLVLPDHRCEKGSTWVLDHDGPRFTAATYLPPG